MKAIETTGIIDEKGHLTVEQLIPLLPAQQVRVLVLAPDETDITETQWLKNAASNEAFDFLNDPAEDIYTRADGRPLHVTK